MDSLREQLSIPNCSNEAEKQEYLRAFFNGEVKILMNGGMGAGFTEEQICEAMAKTNGMGVYSAAIPGWKIGLKKREFQTKNHLREMNARAITNVSKYLRERCEFAIRGANFMELLPSYSDSRDEVLKSGTFDVSLVGAGMDKDLPAVMSKANADLKKKEPQKTLYYMPIVSSVLAAKIYHQRFAKKGSQSDVLRLPDGYYLELPIDKRGNTAGGHLGFPKNREPNADDFDPEAILSGIRKFDQNAVVVLAGGIAYRDQIQSALDMGFNGVSMGTRYLLTQESGMSNDQIVSKYLNPDIGVVLDRNSPTGFWSSRLDVPYTERTQQSVREAIGRCVNCVGENCQFRQNRDKLEDTTFCIYRDLIKARIGEEVGIYFSGGQIVVMRHDDLYQKDGQIHIPTIEEATEYSFTHDAPDTSN